MKIPEPVKYLGFSLLGIGAFWLYRLATTLVRMDLRFVAAKLHKIDWDYVIIRIVLQLTNLEDTNLKLEYLKADVFMDGQPIGYVLQTVGKTLQKYNEESINVDIRITTEKAIDIVGDMLTSGNFLNHAIRMAGFIRVNGYDFPLDETINLSA
jgi:LEA14-like dessication related protein